MSTPEANRMAKIVKVNAGILRDAGFKRRRHCFNRQTEAGLTHVVKFWQHPKEPPAWTEVPGLRERRYGTFRLDFGVYVPEMTRSGSPRGKWIYEHTCDLHRTIGQLLRADQGGDWWQPLSDESAEEIAKSALIEHGLPWLDLLSDHEAVLNGYRTGGPFSIGMAPAGPLDVAEMLHALGRHNEALEVLVDYVSRPVLQSHALYLGDYLPRIGHPDLVDKITVRELVP